MNLKDLIKKIAPESYAQVVSMQNKTSKLVKIMTDTMNFGRSNEIAERLENGTWIDWLQVNSASDIAREINKQDNPHAIACRAAALGDADMIDLIASEAKNINLNQPNRLGRTPVDYAIKKNQPTSLKALAEHGASLSKVDKLGRNLLFAAIEEGKEELAKVILSADPAQAKNRSTELSPLMLAAKMGMHDLAQEMIKAGEDPFEVVNGKSASEIANDDMKRTMAIAASIKDNPEKFDFIQALKEDPKAADEMARDPQSKINFNDFDYDGEPLISHASAITAAVMLSRDNIDRNTQDTKGNSIVSAAILNRDFEKAVILAEGGMNLNLSDKTGHTPIMHAAIAGEPSMLKYLAEKGANLEARNIDGYTSLMMAIDVEDFDSVKALIKIGADPYAIDSEGRMSTEYIPREILSEIGIPRIPYEHAEFNELNIAIDKPISDSRPSSKESDEKLDKILGALNKERGTPSQDMLTEAITAREPDRIKSAISMGAKVNGKTLSSLGGDEKPETIKCIQTLINSGAKMSGDDGAGKPALENFSHTVMSQIALKDEEDIRLYSRNLLRDLNKEKKSPEQGEPKTEQGAQEEPASQNNTQDTDTPADSDHNGVEVTKENSSSDGAGVGRNALYISQAQVDQDSEKSEEWLSVKEEKERLDKEAIELALQEHKIPNEQQAENDTSSQDAKQPGTQSKAVEQENSPAIDLSPEAHQEIGSDRDMDQEINDELLANMAAMALDAKDEEGNWSPETPTATAAENLDIPPKGSKENIPQTTNSVKKIASEAGIFHAVKKLDSRGVYNYCENGGNINIKDNEGNTPLNNLIGGKVERATIKCLYALLNNQADVNMKNSEGDAPVHRVAKLNQSKATLQMFNALMDNGVNMDTKNAKGETALDILNSNKMSKNNRATINYIKSKAHEMEH